MSEIQETHGRVAGTARRLELLAPAGSMDALRAALEAGADAVYLGMTSLNARRAATNFSQEELPAAARLAHERGAKVYLTLNIDIAQRELGQAARILELARQSGVDGVLVRDPALLCLRSLFPEIQFHFSTQTCMANTTDVLGARELGISQVVLARELTLAEIAACSAVGVETEVFAQGALCFCISGRCLLSSWAGGRSGNRGACTSPCRVPWCIGGAQAGTPLSMRDLTTVNRLPELAGAGVKAIKIEGRLKTPQWVGDAVSLYRRALAGENGQELLEEADSLGLYTGRQLTSGYLDGKRDDLTAVAAGRRATVPIPEKDQAPETAEDTQADTDDSATASTFDFELNLEKSLVCRLTALGRTVEWTLPKSVVHRAHKAVAISRFLDDLASVDFDEWRLGAARTNAPQYLLVPRAANNLLDRIASTLRQVAKNGEADDVVRIDLPEEVRNLLASQTAGSRESSPNNLSLGERPDRVRLDAHALDPFVRRVRASGNLDARPSAIIVENLSPQAVEKAVSAAGDIPIIPALPSAFFEDDLPLIRQLIVECARANLRVEANSWGGWWLAREANLRMEAGAGLPVLNSLAARALAQRGMDAATLSIEADRKQLEEITSHCDVPLSMIVFGRPALMTTRVQFPRDCLAKLFVDRRDVRMIPRLERNLWTFRPDQPFDLRRVRNPRIRVAHLVVDLVASPRPADQWLNGPDPDAKPFRFNYSRTLT